ncbi:hypothetical protein V8B97DRAFT_173267 [Scleroderma yunnanense]
MVLEIGQLETPPLHHPKTFVHRSTYPYIPPTTRIVAQPPCDIVGPRTITAATVHVSTPNTTSDRVFPRIVRLLQFNDQLSNENPSKDKLSFWNSWVAEHFTPEASVKFTLWKDNKRDEAKPL